jgi:protein O-mannosyl-transferase
MVERLRERLWIIPALVALCCFANTLGHSFVYDDHYVIVKADEALGDWRLENLVRLFDRDIWSFLSQHLFPNEVVVSQYYRPFFGLFVMVNYLFAGLDPMKWHLTAITLHMIASIVVYSLLLESLRVSSLPEEAQEQPWLALVGALFFAIHPAQSESVGWVSAYVNALSAILILSVLIAYLRARRDPEKIGWFPLSVGAIIFTLALLTKEAAVAVPAIIVAYEFFVIRHDSWPKRLRTTLIAGLPFFILTAGYFAIRVAIFGAVRQAVVTSLFPDLAKASLLVNFFTLPSIILNYIQIIIWPIGLSPMYETRYVLEPGLLNFYLPGAAIIALVAAGFMAARRSTTIRIGLIWLIIPLLPMLDIRSFKPDDLVHDRYVYLSLMGAGLLFAAAGHWLNSRLAEWKGKAEGHRAGLLPSMGIIILALLAALAATTMKQNGIWSDELQMWSVAYERTPDSVMTNLQLGRINEDAGNSREAIFHFKQAVNSSPDSTVALYRLGMICKHVGDLDCAESALKRMAAVSPYPVSRAAAHFNLGLIYRQRSDAEQAIAHIKEGLALDPTGENSERARKILDELTKR